MTIIGEGSAGVVHFLFENQASLARYWDAQKDSPSLILESPPGKSACQAFCPVSLACPPHLANKLARILEPKPLGHTNDPDCLEQGPHFGRASPFRSSGPASRNS
jgi:hypothetical protein